MDRRRVNLDMRASICLASLIVAAVSGGLLTAQSPDIGAFEVVSVKANVSGDERTSSIVMPGARYTATNVTLRMLIKTAYQVHDDQIVGRSRLGEHRPIRPHGTRRRQSVNHGIHHTGATHAETSPGGSVQSRHAS